ncbi:MAG TPA: gas vesicle protein GvpJ [Thermoanaerobaculia bacterium]|nr:gas vesicle protein GvpJ [Thermoanaerobaculia bacterium]
MSRRAARSARDAPAGLARDAGGAPRAGAKVEAGGAAGARVSPALEIIEGADGSLLELVDNLLNQGVVVSGEVILGLAGVDLVYLQLSLLLCAADRVLPRREEP